VSESNTAMLDRMDDSSSIPSAGPPTRRGGFLAPYKTEQGKNTRTGTMAAAFVLIAWGTYFLYDQLRIYEGDAWWQLLITVGIPLSFGIVAFAVSWWACFTNRTAGDFMIATEGEMKKVSWSSRREVIGSTKVVIAFTLLMAVFIFGVDLIFQAFFQWIGVLKSG